MHIPVFLYGTTNPAKLFVMQAALASLPLQIKGIREMAASLPAVAETGRSPLENARLKAEAYYQALGQPVFACDLGLWIDGLPENEQPGTHVRFVQGSRLSDAEMTAHYAAIAKRLGGRAMARYQNAICLLTADGRRYEHTGEDIAGDAFWLLSVPHQKRVAGFPLDCLSARMDNGLYYYDCADPLDAGSTAAAGFRTFFEQVLRDCPRL